MAPVAASMARKKCAVSIGFLAGSVCAGTAGAAGFNPSTFNGAVATLAKTASALFVGGIFTTVGGIAHGGLAALALTTGLVSSYMNWQLQGHHNWNGTTNTAFAPTCAGVPANSCSLR